MADAADRRNKASSTETRRPGAAARDELKRVLDRDVAVQGERSEDASTERAPADPDSPAPAKHKKTP